MMGGAGVMRWGGALVALAGLLCIAGGTRGASGQAGVALGMAPPSTSTHAGSEMFEVDVNVQNVSNLGAYEFVLTFDPEVVEYVSAYDSGFLSSTQRPQTCFGYDIAAAKINEWKALRIGCSTNGLIEGGVGKAGPNGSSTLATVQFRPKAVGESPLVFKGLGTDVYYLGAPDPTKPEGAVEAAHTQLALVEVCQSGEGCAEQDIPFSEGTGIVVVLAPGQATPTALPPTPTPEPREDVNEQDFRKTVEAAVGTPSGRLSTPTAGAGATGSIAGEDGAGGTGGGGVAGTSSGGVSGSGNSAAAGSGGATGRVGPDGAPIAGYGPQESSPSPWWMRVGVMLLSAGLVALAFGLARRPAGSRIRP